ncbi:pyrimidine utilization protein D [soil metagenome]
MPSAAGLHYDLHGRPDGETLILSSGLGGMGGYWAPNLRALSSRYRVLTYDQRGTGRSAGPLPADLTLDHMAGDLLGLMDALGVEHATLIGHALGAHIGLATALRAPGRLTRIVAINAWPSLDPLTARCFDVRLSLLRNSGPEAFLLAQPLFLYPPGWISEHDAQLRAEAAAQLTAFAGPEPIERRIAALRAFDPAPRLHEIDIPVLCVSAADDMLVPSSASQRLADALPQGALATFPWGGHACNVTDAEGFDAAVLAWLDQTRASRS